MAAASTNMQRHRSAMPDYPFVQRTEPGQLTPEEIAQRPQQQSGATVPPLESANDALRERLSIHTKDWDSEWE
jgi:hypothetical protein